MAWNYQFQCLTLYISGTLDHVIEILLHRCKIMISPGVFLYFFKKCSIVNVKIILFLLAHLNCFFLIIIWFSSSSVNAKKKFWVVPHLLHMCVIFCSHLRTVKIIHIENIIITSINYKRNNEHMKEGISNIDLLLTLLRVRCGCGKNCPSF